MTPTRPRVSSCWWWRARPHQEPEQVTLEAGVERMVQLMEAENLSRKEAAKRVAAETGLGKNELYQKSLVN